MSNAKRNARRNEHDHWNPVEGHQHRNPYESGSEMHRHFETEYATKNPWKKFRGWYNANYRIERENQVRAKIDARFANDPGAGSRAKTSLRDWGLQVFHQTARRQRSERGFDPLHHFRAGNIEHSVNRIYEDFYRTHPGKAGDERRSLTHQQQNDFLDKLETHAGAEAWFPGGKRFDLYPQNHGPDFQRRRNAFAYRINTRDPNQQQVDGASGRITFNVHPEYAGEILDKMTTEATRRDVGFHAHQSKVAGPTRFGGGTEDALFYITAGQPNQSITNADLQTMSGRVKLDEHKMADYLAPGLQRIDKGVGYAETPLLSPGSKYHFMDGVHDVTGNTFTSHGMAHSTIIRSAVKSTFKHYGPKPKEEHFKSVYDYKLQRHGLDPSNPARLGTHDRTTVQKPWVP